MIVRSFTAVQQVSSEFILKFLIPHDPQYLLGLPGRGRTLSRDGAGCNDKSRHRTAALFKSTRLPLPSSSSSAAAILTPSPPTSIAPRKESKQRPAPPSPPSLPPHRARAFSPLSFKTMNWLPVLLGACFPSWASDFSACP